MVCVRVGSAGGEGGHKQLTVKSWVPGDFSSFHGDPRTFFLSRVAMAAVEITLELPRLFALSARGLHQREEHAESQRS